VFAVPGDVDRPHVAGCHALIRDGAILARSAQDVLDDLRLHVPALPDVLPKAQRSCSDPLHAELLRALGAGETGLDALLAQIEAPTATILAALSMLELQGLVEARAGQRYCLR
jgi:DNA processing protein